MRRPAIICHFRMCPTTRTVVTAATAVAIMNVFVFVMLYETDDGDQSVGVKVAIEKVFI